MAVRKGMKSPWGRVDGVTHMADGLDYVSTPGHGGVKVSRLRQLEIPKAFRKAGGWYEEDCESAIPEYFCDFLKTQDRKDRALLTLVSYFPEECRSIGLDPDEPLPRLRRAIAEAYVEAHVKSGSLVRVVREVSRTEGDCPRVRLIVRDAVEEFCADCAEEDYVFAQSVSHGASVGIPNRAIRRV